MKECLRERDGSSLERKNESSYPGTENNDRSAHGGRLPVQIMATGRLRGFSFRNLPMDDPPSDADGLGQDQATMEQGCGTRPSVHGSRLGPALEKIITEARYAPDPRKSDSSGDPSQPRATLFPVELIPQAGTS